MARLSTEVQGYGRLFQQLVHVYLTAFDFRARICFKKKNISVINRFLDTAAATTTITTVTTTAAAATAAPPTTTTTTTVTLI